MCGCPFKVRSIHIFGAMNGLVAMGMGGGDGYHAESDWGVWRSAPLEVVSADIHSPAPIPKEGLCHHSPCQGGWNKE